MMRRAVMMTLIVLIACTMLPGSLHAAWVTFTDELDGARTGVELLADEGDRVRLAWSLGAAHISRDDAGQLQVRLPEERTLEAGEHSPAGSGLVRLPWGRGGELNILGGELVHVPSPGVTGEVRDLNDAPVAVEDLVALGQAGIWRDITVAPYSVNPVVEDDRGEIWALTSLTFEVAAGGAMANVPVAPERPVSRAFWPLYQSLVVNELDDLGYRLAETKGTYLIITASNYEDWIYEFVTWKQRKGHHVVVHSYDETQGALQYNELNQIIQDAWETSDPQLEYVLLVGDENRGNEAALPATLITNPAYPSENDATDWRHAALEGLDYFPEIFIGRLTVGTTTEALKASRRVIEYETNGHGLAMNDPYWQRATLVAANFSEGGAQPLTPVATTQWLEERLLESWGFESVCAVYWRSTFPPLPTADDISECINDGSLYVTYRGWGDSHQWAQPEFDVNDIEALNNRHLLPVVTSFVCNTGDFANETNPQSFGEKWIVNGTVAAPTGAVAFVGPTDLHTSTRFNNALIAGFYEGLFAENLSTISQALLRAKMEIYQGFPTERAEGYAVEFYFHVYHVLGDPSLTMWRGAPREMTVNLPAEIALGENYLTVTVSGQGGELSGFYVQTLQGENRSGRYADESGTAVIPLADLEAGELEVVVTHPDYLPVTETVAINEASRYVGVDSWQLDAGGDGLLSAGETGELVVTLRNTGQEDLSVADGALSCQAENVVLESDFANFGAISSGQTADNAGSPFRFTLSGEVPDGAMLEFDLVISDELDTDFHGKIWVPIGGTSLHFVSYESTGGTDFQPGETASLELTLENSGAIALENATAELLSWDEAVTVTTDEVAAPTIDAGGSGTVGPFQVQVAGGTYRGRTVRFTLQLSVEGEVRENVLVTIPLEGATTSDPLGPDSYGYFAYDDTDTAFDEAPVYSWFDLDENAQATHHPMEDDMFFTLELPFDLQFYGEEFAAGEEITVSSNGWVSLAPEGEHAAYFFRNWHLPSTLGPHGIIAPFWDDLKPYPGQETFDLYTWYDSGEGRLIVEWTDPVNFFGHGTSNFPAQMALVIYSQDTMPTTTGDNVIEFHYENVENRDETNNYASVGLESTDHQQGIEYSYANQYPDAAAEVVNGRAIRFTTNAPDDYNEVGGEEAASVPARFALLPNYPNPFNATTEIRFDLPTRAHVRLSVYNVLGQEVARLLDREVEAGHRKVVWQAEDAAFSTGLLFVRLQADGMEAWRKIMYLK